MPIPILMPALSPTMTEGKLAKWLKKEGDTVSSGDVLAEIETDKATMEVEAVDEGVLGKILITEGAEGVLVNAPIALLLEEGEDGSCLDAAVSVAQSAQGAAAGPSALQSSPQLAKPAPSNPQPQATSSLQQGRDRKRSRIFASPLARRLAKQSGLDLALITGTGPHGRVVKSDIEAAVATGKERPASAVPVSPSITAAESASPLTEAGSDYLEVPNSTIRKVIAKRLSESKQQIPHYYLTIDCNLDALLELRQKLNERVQDSQSRIKLSVNDFVVRAVALALRAFPEANSSWTDHAIRLFQTVDVSVAVATSNGLVTPIIRNADNKGLAMIANEIRRLAMRARDGKLMPEEYQGGGFTVSNLGMYGIKEFAAIINPPQSCLLAVGAAEKRPVVKDGALAISTMMSCTLSADHRSVDGAKGAEFLHVFRKLIEDPLSMLL
jgi:pyruvate dehydrogenase E2 component (dihydrolipoamide acetyltransferase)